MISKKKHKLKKWKYYQLSRKFSIFSIIGLVQTLIHIIALGILIDILKYNTLIVTTLVISILYIGKYYVYVAINLIHNHFIKYNIVSIILIFINIFIIWFLVDFIKIYASISSAIAAIFSIIIRFTVLNRIGLIRNE
jgi:putative flippase GtrA